MHTRHSQHTAKLLLHTVMVGYLENYACAAVISVMIILYLTCSMEWVSSRFWFYVRRCILAKIIPKNDFHISALPPVTRL